MASASSIRAARAFVELFADTSKLQQGLRQAENMLKEFSTRATTLGRTVTAAGGIMIAPIAASIKTFYQFDDNMREVQAVTKATGKEFDTLTEKAKKLGRETSFTAIQVSQAMGTLGRAGFKTKEIDDSISSILTLARSTRTDLNDAAKIASIAMRGFVLEASDMEHVVDVLATVSNGAALNLTDFGESLKYVAPVAQQAGMSIEDAAGAIGVLSNFGIKGTMAGTALKNILTRMANTEVAAKFKQIGVETKDAQGNLRALIDVLYDVAKATQYMGSGDRMEIFKGLADLRALPSFAVMANNPEKIVEMIDELRESMGKAAEMSALMDAGLGGSFRRFISAVESASISLAEAVSGPLQEWMISIKEGINVFNSWTKAHGKVILSYAKGAMMLIALGGAMYGVGKAAQILSSTFAMIRGGIKGLSGGFTLLTNSLIKFSGTDKLLEAHQKAVKGERKAQQDLGKAQSKLNQTMLSRQHWQEVLANATKGTKAYTYAEDKLAQATDREFIAKRRLTEAQLRYNAAQKAAVNAAKPVGGGTPGGIAWAALRGTYHRLGGNITDQTNWFAGKRVLRDILSMLETVKNVSANIGRSLVNALISPFQTFRNVMQSTAQFFVNVWGRSINSVRAAFLGLRRAFSGQSITNAINTAFGAIKAFSLKTMIASIKGIGIAAKASAVGVGILKIGLQSLVNLAGGIASLAGSLLLMKGIGNIMSAFSVDVKEDTFAQGQGARLDARSEELQSLMRQLNMLQEAQKNHPLSDEAFERAKYAIDTLNKSVAGLGLTYDELAKTISIASDAQEKLTEGLKQQKEINLLGQIRAKNEAIQKIRDKRATFDMIMGGADAGMTLDDAAAMAFSIGLTEESAMAYRKVWATLTKNPESIKEFYEEMDKEEQRLTEERGALEDEHSKLVKTDATPGENEEDVRKKYEDKYSGFQADPFTDNSLNVDSLLSNTLSTIDVARSPAERINAIQEKLAADQEAAAAEVDRIGAEANAFFSDVDSMGVVQNWGVNGWVQDLEEEFQNGTKESFRDFLERSRTKLGELTTGLTEQHRQGLLSDAEYDKAMQAAQKWNNFLPQFERQFALSELLDFQNPDYTEKQFLKTPEQFIDDVLGRMPSGWDHSGDFLNYLRKYAQSPEMVQGLIDKFNDDPDKLFEAATGLSRDQMTTRDYFGTRSVLANLPDWVGDVLVSGGVTQGLLSKAAQQQIDEISEGQLSSLESYISKDEDGRAAELAKNQKEFDKQMENVDDVAAALQASGKVLSYGDMVADGSDVEVLKQILQAIKEQTDAEINQKYDEMRNESVAEALKNGGASYADIARIAYGEDTSWVKPLADVSGYQNAIAEADRAFNAGEMSEYESDVAKYNALAAERDALLNSGDLQFLGKKLEDAQETFKQAQEAYEQNQNDDTAKALEDAAQALEQISDQYEGAYDAMLGSIDDALQDLENKSYQEENENAGFERAKVEYGSRGSFSAYEGSSLGESQIDIRIEKNTAETVTLLRDTFHWWKQMYEPQSVFA